MRTTSDSGWRQWRGCRKSAGWCGSGRRQSWPVWLQAAAVKLAQCSGAAVQAGQGSATGESGSAGEGMK